MQVMAYKVKSNQGLTGKFKLTQKSKVVFVIHLFLAHSGAMRLKNLTVFSLGAKSYLNLLYKSKITADKFNNMHINIIKLAD